MTQSANRQLTDAAAEYARVMQLLLEVGPKSGVSAASVIDKFVNQRRSNDILRIYDVLYRRGDSLINFINSLNDEFIDDDLKEATTSAIATLNKTFSYGSISAPWDNVLSNYIKRENIQSVKFISRTVRQYRPIIKVTEAELANVISSLDNAIVDIVSNNDLPDWANHVLVNAIHDLQFAINNFILLGYDETIDQVLKLQGNAQAVVIELNKRGLPIARLERLALVFVLLTDLFTSAPNISQSLPIWRGWVRNITEVTTPLIAPPPKMIEGPKHAIDASKPAIEEL